MGDRLRSQGLHAVSGSDQNDGAVQIFSPHHVSEIFPGSAQTTFDAEQREDSELLDGPLRSQGSLDTLARPQNTGVRDQNPGGLTREKVSISQLPGFDLDELLDEPFRSHGRCATEATVQNSSDMDTFSTCHNRDLSPVPHKQLLMSKSVGKRTSCF